MSDLGSIRAVVPVSDCEQIESLIFTNLWDTTCERKLPVNSHEKEVDIPRVGHDETTVSVGHQMARLLVAAVANGWHRDLALEASTHATIDT